MALKLFNDKILKPKESKPPAVQPTRPPAAAPSMTERVVSANRTAFNKEDISGQLIISKYPIIIVPSAVTSCITLLNAKEFFIDGLYTTVEVKKQQGARREKELDIVRPGKASNEIQTYRVIDDPTKLTNEDWDRVVAVFVTGQLWQFKGWKYSNPVELFQHVLGLHLTFDDRVIDPTILTWNCKVLKVITVLSFSDLQNKFFCV